MENAITIAKYIVNKYPMTHLKLQKILYFIKAKGLLQNNEVFYDDIEAWDYGPVVPSVYHFFKTYGYYVISSSENVIIPNDIRMIVDDVCNQLSTYSAEYLVEITHRYETWKNVYNTYTNGIIHSDEIKKYHKLNGF